MFFFSLTFPTVSCTTKVIDRGVATRHAAGLRGRKIYGHEGVAVHGTRVCIRQVYVHGGASEHALAAGDVCLHCCGGWL